MTAVYDAIGGAYASHRRPDPRIAQALWSALGPARSVLDVGAGAGSYEPADRAVIAVEPSVVMIAQRPKDGPPVVMANADTLPFDDNSFDAAMAVFTVHHWRDPTAGLLEMQRVSDRQVVLTFDPTIHNRFWLLTDYIPAAATLEASRGLSLEQVTDALQTTTVITLPVPHDCIDGFGWAYWRRPEAYLDAEVRSCISMLAQLEPQQVEHGLARLAADITSGEWAREHRDLLGRDTIDGGYRIVVAEQR